MNGPQNERKTPMAKKNFEIVTIFGNLGGEPKVHQLPEQDGTRPGYDPVTDTVVEMPFTREAREFRTFSLAVKTKEMEEPRWIHCIDWTNESRLFLKGDRLKVIGHFEVRTYEKDGETKRHKQLVVKAALLERAKIRAEAA
jgi:single-stranded DNA-binding protein